MKRIQLIIGLLLIVAYSNAQVWNGDDIEGISYRYGSVGIGTNTPTATGEGKVVHILATGDKWPFFRLERTGGISKINIAWETFISSDGSYYVRDIRDGIITDPFVIQPGAPTNSFKMLGNGNIGIGINNPSSKLDVLGDIRLKLKSADASNTKRDSPSLIFVSSGYASDNKARHQLWNINSVSSSTWGAGDLVFSSNKDGSGYNERMRLFENGSVGIGTQNTGNYKLAVNGSIRAKEITVDTDWADFVFEDNYKLRDLKDVESFIKENNHLPDIPSEKEVKEKGVCLGDMDAKLLQKIEELTLYMIEMNKRIYSLESENSELKEKLNELEYVQ